MEDFWQNIKDGAVLLAKVCVFALIIDIVLRLYEMEFRMPFISHVTEWIFFQFG